MAKRSILNENKMAARICNREDNHYYKHQMIKEILRMYSDEMHKAMLNGERVQITGVCTLIPEVKVHEGKYNMPVCNKTEGNPPPYAKIRISDHWAMRETMNKKLMQKIKTEWKIFGTATRNALWHIVLTQKKQLEKWRKNNMTKELSIENIKKEIMDELLNDIHIINYFKMHIAGGTPISKLYNNLIFDYDSSHAVGDYIEVEVSEYDSHRATNIGDMAYMVTIKMGLKEEKDVCAIFCIYVLHICYITTIIRMMNFK